MSKRQQTKNKLGGSATSYMGGGSSKSSSEGPKASGLARSQGRRRSKNKKKATRVKVTHTVDPGTAEGLNELETEVKRLVANEVGFENLDRINKSTLIDAMVGLLQENLEDELIREYVVEHFGA